MDYDLRGELDTDDGCFAFSVAPRAEIWRRVYAGADYLVLLRWSARAAAAAAAAELGTDVFTQLWYARAPFRGTVRGSFATRWRLS